MKQPDDNKTIDMWENTMKTYQVELKRTSYVTMTVEAANKEQAEELAWAELASDGSWNDSHGNWEMESIGEPK
jgi:Tfp pilus assembly major pilin PilA